MSFSGPAVRVRGGIVDCVIRRYRSYLFDRCLQNDHANEEVAVWRVAELLGVFLGRWGWVNQ
ncbi:hypothetical protein OAL43_01495 [bacterium]|nr:hypothetical protein [bacterium]